MRSLLHLAGQKRPNTLDIYDRAGNVLLWVEDCYDRYNEERPRNNPCSPSRGGDRVYRDGSLQNRAEDLQTVKRERKSNRRGNQTIECRLVPGAVDLIPNLARHEE